MSIHLAIRVDASAQIGTGHLKRCLSLAQAVCELGGKVSVVWRDHGFDCSKMIEQAGCHSLRLPQADSNQDVFADGPAHAKWAGIAQSEDALQTAALLAGYNPDWLLVDHYAFDAVWHRLARRGQSWRIGVIDDLGDRAIEASLLIDHNPSADHSLKYAASGMRPDCLLGGANYALLGPDYQNIDPLAVNPHVRSIGIFMGGADSANHSAMALAACRTAGFTGPITIVSTAANPNLKTLAKAVKEDPDTELLTDLPSLAGFFGSHDLQIGAGGGATWERCRAGVPALVISTAANQNIVLDALRSADGAIVVDHPTDSELRDKIAALLKSHDVRTRIAQNAAKLVDGRGAERVALVMARDQATTVRLATVNDARLVHDWRNDPTTRAASGGQAPIELSSHMAWFAASVAEDSNRHIFIGQIGPVPIGVVRFDRESNAKNLSVFEISIFLDPKLRGLGLGPYLLRAAEDALTKLVPPPLRVTAKTRTENHASQLMFRNCGYQGVTNFTKEFDGAHSLLNTCMDMI